MYFPIPSSPSGIYHHQGLKQRIRRLRFYTRGLSLLLSIAAFVPLALTLYKFLSTRNDYRSLQTTTGNLTRTAWAFNTRAWPTYMYFSIALFSLVVNSAVMISYACGVKAANRTARIGTAFTVMVILMDVAVWMAAVIIYKVEKDLLTDNKHTDIWGWTCSAAAREIQAVFTNVPYDQYCNIQKAGWIAGLLEVGVLSMSAVIFWFVWRRSVSKEKVRKKAITAQLLQGTRS